MVGKPSYTDDHINYILTQKFRGKNYREIVDGCKRKWPNDAPTRAWSVNGVRYVCYSYSSYPKFRPATLGQYQLNSDDDNGNDGDIEDGDESADLSELDSFSDSTLAPLPSKTKGLPGNGPDNKSAFMPRPAALESDGANTTVVKNEPASPPSPYQRPRNAAEAARMNTQMAGFGRYGRDFHDGSPVAKRPRFNPMTNAGHEYNNIPRPAVDGGNMSEPKYSLWAKLDNASVQERPKGVPFEYYQDGELCTGMSYENARLGEPHHFMPPSNSAPQVHTSNSGRSKEIRDLSLSPEVLRSYQENVLAGTSNSSRSEQELSRFAQDDSPIQESATVAYGHDEYLDGEQAMVDRTRKLHEGLQQSAQPQNQLAQQSSAVDFTPNPQPQNQLAQQSPAVDLTSNPQPNYLQSVSINGIKGDPFRGTSFDKMQRNITLVPVDQAMEGNMSDPNQPALGGSTPLNSSVDFATNNSSRAATTSMSSNHAQGTLPSTGEQAASNPDPDAWFEDFINQDMLDHTPLPAHATTISLNQQHATGPNIREPEYAYNYTDFAGFNSQEELERFAFKNAEKHYGKPDNATEPADSDPEWDGMQARWAEGVDQNGNDRFMLYLRGGRLGDVLRQLQGGGSQKRQYREVRVANSQLPGGRLRLSPLREVSPPPQTLNEYLRQEDEEIAARNHAFEAMGAAMRQPARNSRPDFAINDEVMEDYETANEELAAPDALTAMKAREESERIRRIAMGLDEEDTDMADVSNEDGGEHQGDQNNKADHNKLQNI